MIVAIDPGITGAAAVLCPERGYISVIDLPTFTIGKRREINTIMFLQWLRDIKPGRIIMENVHSMPKQGIAGTFYLGVAVGMLKATCRMMRLSDQLELVEPQVWKAYFKLASDKEAARQLALQLYPGAACRLTRKKDHNRAEALLIARYALRPPIGRDW